MHGINMFVLTAIFLRLMLSKNRWQKWLTSLGICLCHSVFSIVWRSPPNEWVKANYNGSMPGSPGYWFEAKLLATIFAIEIIVARGLMFLWLETYSVYIAHLCEEIWRRFHGDLKLVRSRFSTILLICTIEFHIFTLQQK